MRMIEASELVHQNLWRMAEQETLFLMQSYRLSPQEVIRQYTGKTPEQAGLEEAVGVVYSFNLSQAYHNGFVAY
jgi:hypothetical protein